MAGFLLHRKDGEVKAVCLRCGKLCIVPVGSNGDAVCGGCVRKCVAVEQVWDGPVYTARDWRRMAGETR